MCALWNSPPDWSLACTTAHNPRAAPNSPGARGRLARTMWLAASMALLPLSPQLSPLLAFPSCCFGFLGRELVGVAARVSCSAAQACNLALLIGVHRGEATPPARRVLNKAGFFRGAHGVAPGSWSRRDHPDTLLYGCRVRLVCRTVRSQAQVSVPLWGDLTRPTCYRR